MAEITDTDNLSLMAAGKTVRLSNGLEMKFEVTGPVMRHNLSSSNSTTQLDCRT